METGTATRSAVATAHKRKIYLADTNGAYQREHKRLRTVQVMFFFLAKPVLQDDTDHRRKEKKRLTIWDLCISEPNGISLLFSSKTAAATAPTASETATFDAAVIVVSGAETIG